MVFKNVGKFLVLQKRFSCNVLNKIFFKRDFLSPGHDRVVTIKSRNFFYCERLVLSGFLYWSSRGCNLAAHSSIHASFILRRGLIRLQLPKLLLTPENSRVQEYFWYTGMRLGWLTDGKHYTHCSQSFVSPDGILLVTGFGQVCLTSVSFYFLFIWCFNL